MDIKRPNTTTVVQALTKMVQYCRYICPRQSHTLAPLAEAVSNHKGRVILWNENLEVVFHELNNMLSVETPLDYPDWKIPFTVHTYASDKQLGAFISKNDKPIDLSWVELINPQCN